MSSNAVPADPAVGVALDRVVDESAGLADPGVCSGIGHRRAGSPSVRRCKTGCHTPHERLGCAGVEVDRPGPGEELNTGRATVAAAGRLRDPAARRRRDARAAARAAHPAGPVHGRRLGVPRRRASTRTRARATAPTGSRRSASSRRRPASLASRPAALVQVLAAGSRRAEVKIRFDTHFFLARCPRRTRPRSTATRSSTSAGSRPQDALDAHRRGELVLVFPTIKHLEQLAPFASATELLELRAGREVVAGRAAGDPRGRGRARRAAGRARLRRRPRAHRLAARRGLDAHRARHAGQILTTTLRTGSVELKPADGA